MTHESINTQEGEISWLSTADRFTKKIEEEIEHIGDSHPRVIKLQELQSDIHDIFIAYDHKKMTIKEVEDDLKYRLKNSESDFEKQKYQQILSFVDARFQFTI